MTRMVSQAELPFAYLINPIAYPLRSTRVIDPRNVDFLSRRLYETPPLRFWQFLEKLTLEEIMALQFNNHPYLAEAQHTREGYGHGVSTYRTLLQKTAQRHLYNHPELTEQQRTALTDFIGKIMERAQPTDPRMRR